MKREKLGFVGLSEEWILNSCVRYWAESCYLTVEVRLHLAAVKFEGMCCTGGSSAVLFNVSLGGCVHSPPDLTPIPVETALST